MWTLMRKADVRNYKLSHSHSRDQCVPGSKSEILSQQEPENNCPAAFSAANGGGGGVITHTLLYK